MKPTSQEITRARSLRRDATPPERLLWSFLRTLRAEGKHFRRQAPFRGSVLDFLCFSQRIVIEVDGAAHGDEARRVHDTVRDAVLAREGFITLRFLAADLLRNLEGVAFAIRAQLASPPTPALPTRGREKRVLRVVAVLLLLLSVVAPVRAQHVAIPADGLSLQAQFYQPSTVVAPAIVALHGCGGPYPARDRQWREILLGAGHPVLFPDSFGSRGLGPQCTVSDRGITPGRERRADAVAAVRWLVDQPTTPPGGVVVLGWSNGGSTVLAAAAEGVMPARAVRGFVAFYPGCRIYADRPAWAPSAPLLILIGAADDWTPAEPCRRLAARFPDRITLIEYPGAYHDFDAPSRPIRTRTGLAFTGSGTGVAHTGTNEPAREDAISRVLAFLQHR